MVFSGDWEPKAWERDKTPLGEVVAGRKTFVSMGSRMLGRGAGRVLSAIVLLESFGLWLALLGVRR